jgi:hypothetical protein
VVEITVQSLDAKIHDRGLTGSGRRRMSPCSSSRFSRPPRVEGETPTSLAKVAALDCPSSQTRSSSASSPLMSPTGRRARVSRASARVAGKKQVEQQSDPQLTGRRLDLKSGLAKATQRIPSRLQQLVQRCCDPPALLGIELAIDSADGLDG